MNKYEIIQETKSHTDKFPHLTGDNSSSSSKNIIAVRA